MNLWEKLNFPVLSKQQVSAKVNKLLTSFVKHRKRPNAVFEEYLARLFDITKISGNWLSSEDKKMYKVQIESEGRVGYTTLKRAPISTVHPLKRAKRTPEHSTSEAVNSISSSTDTADESSSGSDYTETVPGDSPRKHAIRQSTKSAAKLVSKHCLSTRKTSRVLKSIAEDGVSLPTPSQSGVWRRTIKDAEEMKIRLMELICKEKFCLHFDGKKINKTEYQVVCLKNGRRTLHLGILVCDSGSSASIYKALQDLLDEYKAWNSIQMIISDTTAVNTGRKNGVVPKLQKTFRDKGFDVPQYIGCQNHILDLVLRHVLDFFFPIQSTSPNINYKFIDQILEQYDDLQNAYKGTAVVAEYENLGRRDDFKFLFELCEAYKLYKNEEKWPRIKWQKLSSLHSARWNSRGIFALIAFFLLPNWRQQLRITCDFIATAWSRAWFSNQHYSETDYEDLLSAISQSFEMLLYPLEEGTISA